MVGWSECLSSNETAMICFFINQIRSQSGCGFLQVSTFLLVTHPGVNQPPCCKNIIHTGLERGSARSQGQQQGQNWDFLPTVMKCVALDANPWTTPCQPSGSSGPSQQLRGSFKGDFEQDPPSQSAYGVPVDPCGIINICCSKHHSIFRSL